MADLLPLTFGHLQPAVAEHSHNGNGNGRPRAALSLTRPADVETIIGAGEATSGLWVNPETSLKFSAVWACVQVLAEDVAKLPLIMYRRKDNGGKERATDHPLYWLLHDQPNSWQSSYDWRSQSQAHIELRGNAFSHVVRYRNEVRELIPIPPSDVTVEQDDRYRVTYSVRQDRGSPKEYKAENILHVHGLSVDGLVGMSRIAAAREGIGLGLAAERHGGRMFRNGARASAVVKHPSVMSDEAAKRFKEQTEAAITGDNAFRLLVLEEGAELVQVGLSNEDAEWLASRKFQVEDIARFFRVPLHKIQHLDRATFNNIEHMALEYVIDSLLSRLNNWEQRLRITLLTPAERKEFHFEFLVDGLLRGDTKSRWESHRLAKLTGALNANEIRAMENRDPYEGGEVFFRESNTVPHDAPVAGAPTTEIAA